MTKQKWFLDTLGTEWYLDFYDRRDNIPAGHKKPIVFLSLPGPTPAKIQELARQAPGSVWYLVGEPNRRGADYRASAIVPQLRDLYTAIKEADKTARITSPTILNWDFTCLGCLGPGREGGYQPGRSWVAEFRAEYLRLYNTEPPIDIWAIDIYPLDWDHRPTVNHQLAIDQMVGISDYLNSIPAQRGKPIWILELGLHWGWNDWQWWVEGCGNLPSPAGTYQTQRVIEYLDAIFDWLDANADSKNIEKWFLLSTYYDITTCNDSAYAGLTLFDSPEPGANLTPVGEFFRNRVLGIPQ